MSIREVIQIMNQMQADGVIESYAIGGAVGATFYLEPIATLDVDIFIRFKSEPPGPLVSLSPIYEYLKMRGGMLQGECVVLSGWPVQFLPAGNPLVEEALTEAIARHVGGDVARVFRAEHLAAIALQTGRAKDKARLLQFVEGRSLEMGRFQDILQRHGLMAAWQRFQRQFMGESR